MSDLAKPDHLLFDLGGQNVAVTDLGIDEQGRLRATWVLLDKKRKYQDDEIEQMLNKAISSILEKAEV